MQQKWSRFLNTASRADYNVPCDLHMELLNILIKGILLIMGSNINSTSITRAKKSLGVVYHVSFAKIRWQRKQ